MRILTSGVALVAILGAGGMASANMSYSPWIHRLVQNGQDVEVTVNVFDESSHETFRDVPFPSFDVAYSLQRWGLGEKWIFEDRVFDKAEARSVSDYECQWESEEEESREEETCQADTGQCVDCDGDGVPECPPYRFCAVAYRFTVVDACVPPPGVNDADGLAAYYHLTSRELETAGKEFEEYEGFGHQNIGVEDTGDPCPTADPEEESALVSGDDTLTGSEDEAGTDAGVTAERPDDISADSEDETDNSSGCSVSAIGRPAGPSIVAWLFNFLI